MIVGIEWRAVPWLPAYEVSNFGEVRKRINATHPERRQLMLMRLYADKDGYLYLRLTGQKWLVHRLVYAVFCGPLVRGLVVCHRDGNKQNNSAENLLQATQRENISHKREHGTWQAGERHPRAKHTDAQVAQVKAALAQTSRSKTGRLKRGEAGAIAATYGVSIHTVRDLASKGYWRHV